MKKATRFHLIDGLLLTILVCINVISMLPAYSHAESKNAGTALPSALIGAWQVSEVHVDSGTSRTLHVQYNDPALKGRLLTISPQKMVSNISYGDVCTDATLISKKMTAAALIKHSMGWRMISPEVPTTKDYKLPLSGKDPVEVLSVNCKDGLWGRELGQNGGIMGAWIIVLPTGRLAMRWYDESILVLSRVSADAKPKPSFNCSKATTPTEKAICGSIELASFDLSVAESYKKNIRGFTEGKDPSAVKRVKASQKTWLKKRDACGANAACLKKTMEEQLEVLGDLEKFYNPE